MKKLKNKYDEAVSSTDRILSEREAEILLHEYSRAYDFYEKELASRREYLKWYTSLLAAGVALVGYFTGKNQPSLMLAILIGLLALGLASFRVVLASSLSALDAFSRFAQIQEFWRSTYTKLNECLKPHTLYFIENSQLSHFPLFKFGLPYILTIFIVLNSLTSSALSLFFLYVCVGVRSKSVLVICALLFYTLPHILQRAVAVNSYMHCRKTVMKVNIGSQNGGSHEKENQGHSAHKE